LTLLFTLIKDGFAIGLLREQDVIENARDFVCGTLFFSATHSPFGASSPNEHGKKVVHSGEVVVLLGRRTISAVQPCERLGLCPTTRTHSAASRLHLMLSRQRRSNDVFVISCTFTADSLGVVHRELMSRVVIEDSYQRIARLGCCV
jgi:hypothetical protein